MATLTSISSTQALDLPLHPAETLNSAESILEATFEGAHGSSALLGTRIPVQVAGRRHSVPRFMLLGQRAGGVAIRLALVAGVEGQHSETTAALSRLLLQYELAPRLARDYAIFAYPLVNPAGAEGESAAGAAYAERFAAGEGEDVSYLRSELREWQFDGVITLRVDETAQGFYARVPSALIGAEVVAPALQAISRSLPVAPSWVVDQPSNATLLGAELSQSRATPGRQRPQPFHFELVAPGAATWEQRATGLFLATQEVLRNYRRFISHAANL